MSGWVPLTVTEVRLLRLIEEGLLLSKELARWRVTTGEVNLVPWPDVSFTDFHEHGLGNPMLDFLRGFLREYGVQL